MPTRHLNRRHEKRNIILRTLDPDIILKKTKQVDSRTPSEFPEKKAGKGGDTLVSDNATRELGE
jgi:hypothetical protein